MADREKAFTPGEIARLCGASPRTVQKWIDAGLLSGWRLPSGDRRVTREALLRFMGQYGMPVDLVPGGDAGRDAPACLDDDETFLAEQDARRQAYCDPDLAEE